MAIGWHQRNQRVTARNCRGVEPAHSCLTAAPRSVQPIKAPPAARSPQFTFACQPGATPSQPCAQIPPFDLTGVRPPPPAQPPVMQAALRDNG
jgi:hypothetical protein